MYVRKYSISILLTSKYISPSKTESVIMANKQNEAMKKKFRENIEAAKSPSAKTHTNFKPFLNLCLCIISN